MAQWPSAALITVLLFGAISATSSCTSEKPPPANVNVGTNANKAQPSPVSGDPAAPSPVQFVTEDDFVTINGDLYLPDKKGPAPALLALHQWKADRSTYRDFARTMRDAGFVVLAIDARGFGESTESSDGKVEPAWNTSRDIAAAVKYLLDQPSVDGQRIGLVGASYGASNALIYAAKDGGANVRSVVLLSPGLNYNNSLPTEPAIKTYGDRPLLMVAARDDAQPAADTEKLAASAKNARYETKILDKGGHGTDLLKPGTGGTELVKEYFIRTLTGPIAVRDKPGATANENAEGGGDANVSTDTSNQNGNAKPRDDSKKGKAQ